jgi:hypothetical protein
LRGADRALVAINFDIGRYLTIVSINLATNGEAQRTIAMM